MTASNVDKADDCSATVTVKRWPAYLPVVVVLTIVYLAIELPFNARLLDITGGEATLEQIESIELWGRLISGFALTLAVWGAIIIPRAYATGEFGKGVFFAVAAATLIIPSMYKAQEWLIEGIVDGSNGHQRKAALSLSLFAHALLEERLIVDGIDLSPDQIMTPEGKTFIALFPMLALSTDDLEKKAEAALRAIVWAEIEDKMGGAAGSYQKMYLASLERLRGQYNAYVDGVNQLRATLSDIPRVQAKQWDRFERELAERNWTPISVPQRHWRRVANRVRDNGVSVSNDWDPADKRSFYRAIRSKIERQARESFDRASQQQVGALLPDNLSWSAFVSHPEIQKRWKREIALANDVQLTERMSLSEFTTLIYEPMIHRETDQRVETYSAATESFEDAGTNAYEGRAAIKRLIVPPIALVFSLIGGVMHLFKLSSALLRFSGAPHRVTALCAASILIALSFLAYTADNAMTSSRVYSYFEAQTAKSFNPGLALTMRWVINMQPYAYPVNEALRETILGGFQFGYKPSLS